MRIHTSPSIQITEIDKSQYSPAMTGSSVFIQGFSSKGEAYRPTDITSRTAFTTIFGEPETEAERYAFAAVVEVLNNQGKVCFARLPYDNDSFEKVVGFKYSVSDMSDNLGATDYKVIYENDSEIQQYCTITAAEQPITYDLAKIEEYRTDEDHVAPNTFLIVDTTGSKYGRITEDYRKGKRRELIGIIPVVTTAANALYAQSLINVSLDKISAYETISADCLTTLSGNVLSGSDGEPIKGLKQTDLFQKINTIGNFFKQSCSFSTVTIQYVSGDMLSSTDVWYDAATSAKLDVHMKDLSTYYADNIKNAITTLSALSSYSDGVIKVTDDGLSCATMISATKLTTEEWHGVNGDDSVPPTLCRTANEFFASIQPASDGIGFDPEHLKDIGVVVFKSYLDPAEGNKVTFEPAEAYCGSLYKDDKDPNTGVSKFIDNIVNSRSSCINFFSNCFSSAARKDDYLKKLDILIAKPTNGVSLGLYEDMTKKYISIGKSIYDGMNKAQEKAKSINDRDIDIVPDAGLANIASFIKAIYGEKGEYDLTVTDSLGNSLLANWKAADPSNAAVKIWKGVEQKLDNFCKNVRKDCMFIADGLRPLCIQGNKKLIRDSKPTNTLEKDFIPYLKCIAGLNTSYGAGYCDWFEQADDITGDLFWCPPSIKACGIYVNTDVNYNYWDAPAGLTRGKVTCVDVAFSPTTSQADFIYDKSWNYAVSYPNDGVILEGQKTLQTKPTALDRVNVRRTLLRLERAVGNVAKYFLYEGNTSYTRQRLVDAIDPYFRNAKIGGGLTDYKLICDDSINTPETIDANELHVKCLLKPTRTIEYIDIQFIIGTTGATWAELL